MIGRRIERGFAERLLLASGARYSRYFAPCSAFCNSSDDMDGCSVSIYKVPLVMTFGKRSCSRESCCLPKCCLRFDERGSCLDASERSSLRKTMALQDKTAA